MRDSLQGSVGSAGSQRRVFSVSEASDVKFQQNQIGLDPRKAIVFPSNRRKGGINEMNLARMTLQQSNHQNVLLNARLNKLNKEKELTLRRMNE